GKDRLISGSDETLFDFKYPSNDKSFYNSESETDLDEVEFTREMYKLRHLSQAHSQFIFRVLIKQVFHFSHNIEQIPVE
ncbi:17038_t:CDS:2, partial [Funneliformis geosporum]